MHHWRRAFVTLAVVAWAATTPADEPRLAEFYGFQPLEIYKLDPRIKGLLVRDFDGDKIDDVAIVNNGRSRIDLLLSGKSAADPQPSTSSESNQLRNDRRMRLKSLPVNKDILSMVAGDFNGDGKLDIAYYGAPAELTVVFNQGKGNFGDAKRINTGEAVESGAGLTVGDLNRDGLDDIALLAANEVVIVHQRKEGGLGEPEHLPHAATNARMIKAVDFDGDGGDDLIVFDGGNDAPVRARFSSEGGRLGPEVRLSIESPRAFAFAELDGKPGQELLTIEGQSGRAKVFTLETGEEDASAHKGRLIFYPMPKGDARGRSLALGDLDGDKKTDVVVSDPANAQFLVFRQGKGGLGSGQSFPGLVGGKALQLADFDGDGKDEVVVLSEREKQIGLSRLSDNRLSFPSPLPTSGEPVALDVARLDRDKAPNVVYVARETIDGPKSKEEVYRLRALEREPSGRFVAYRWGADDAVTIRGLSSSPVALKLADLNHDSLMDFLIFRDDGPPMLLLGRAGGEPPAPAGGGLGPLAGVEPAGLGPNVPGGGDGLLIAQNTFARRLALDKTGQWQVQDQYGVERGSAQIIGAAAIDLDHDGTEEVALLDKTSKALVFLAKSKEGVYRPSGGLPIGPIDFRGAHVADLDGDGHPDLLLAGTDKFGVVLTGRKGQRLKAIAGYESNRREAQFGDLIAGDLNSDGRPDIVLTDIGEHFVEIVAVSKPVELDRGLSFKVFEQKSFRDRDSLVEPRDLALGDVDGDARTDLILIVHDRVLVYRQDPGKPREKTGDK
jgi:FG-GAP-like repeat